MPIRVRGLPAVEVGVRVVKSDGQRLDLLHLVWSLLQQHNLGLGRVVGLGLVVVGVRGSVVGVGMVGFGLVVSAVVGLGVMVGVVVGFVMGFVVGFVVMVRVVVGLGVMVRVVVGLGVMVGIGCKEVRFFIEVLVVEGRVLRRPLVLVQHKVVEIFVRYDVFFHAAVAEGVELGKGSKVSCKIIVVLVRDRLSSRRRGGQGLGAVRRGARFLWWGRGLWGVTGKWVISVVRFGSQFVRVKRRVERKVAGAEGAEPKVRNLSQGEIDFFVGSRSLFGNVN